MARIMVVDDEPTIVLVLKEVLTDAGHEIITAGDGRLALEKLATSPKPDLLIIDLFMPGMGGREFIEKVRSDPDFSNTPIMLITGSIPTVKDFPPGGSYREILCKPFDIEDVIRKVDHILEAATTT